MFSTASTVRDSPIQWKSDPMVREYSLVMACSSTLLDLENMSLFPDELCDASSVISVTRARRPSTKYSTFGSHIRYDDPLNLSI